MKRKITQSNSETEAIFRLPDSLKELIAFYTMGQGQASLTNIQLGEHPVFTGRGVDFLAAQYAAGLCRQAGTRATAYSESEIRSYPEELFTNSTSLAVFGGRVEADVIEKFSHLPGYHLDADANNAADGKLNELRLINTMTLAWLMVRQSSGRWDGSESATLQPIRQRARLMAEGLEPYLARCRDLLKYSPRWILLGGERQQEVMQFTASLLAKKAGRLVPWVLYDDYADNYEQLVDPDAALIHLRGSEDPAVDVLLDLAEEKGAVVVEVTEGFFGLHRSQKIIGQGIEPDLIPLLGCMAGNLLAISDQIG